MPVFLLSLALALDDMIQFKNISKHFELKGQTVTALDQINLEIPAGCIFGIIGYSGAGKSTLIRLINLLERPSQGQIIINDKDFTALNARELRQERTNIGMIFQHFNLLQTKTVAENIEMPLTLLGVGKAERQKRLDELLEFIDLKHKKDAFPDELSGGQKQRVAAARSLISNPDIILADEPTGALDTKAARLLMEKLQEVNQVQGRTILMVTHDPNAASFCSRILFIQDGVIFHELRRKVPTETREEFYARILQVMAQMGGGSANVL